MSPRSGRGSHHRAAGHQRQEPAVHRVCDRQQRQDPRQRAVHRGGGGLVEKTPVKQKQRDHSFILMYWRSIRSPLTFSFSLCFLTCQNQRPGRAEKRFNTNFN